MKRSLDVRFRAQVVQDPEAIAFVFADKRKRRRLSELCGVEAIGGQLQAAGILPGNRILLLEPVSPRLYAVLPALFRIGAPAVLSDPTALSETVSAACAETTPKAMVGPEKAQFLRLGSAALRRIPLAFCSSTWLPCSRRLWFVAAERWRCELASLHLDASALISFTSGSGGPPKVVVRSHRKLLAQEEALAGVLDMQRRDACLSTLPLFVLAFLAAGGDRGPARSEGRGLVPPDPAG